ncbi:MAG: hypothetical protein ACTHK4_17900 [Mycobacteriales bacterium]
MPTRRTAATPPALTDADVADLREKVTAGEKPRVVIRTASAAVAAGTRGNVIRVGNPKEGEFIVVRLGKDEVPFAPAELGIAGRTAPPAKAAPAASPVAAVKPAPRPAKRTPAAKSRGARSAKRVPPLTVTLRFKDGGWTVEALRGARRVARPTVLRPGAVSALAEHLDEDALRDAIVEAVESSRSVVEAERAELRAKLDAAEAALRDYDARPRRRAGH